MTLCDQNSKSLLDKIEKNVLKMLVKMHLNAFPILRGVLKKQSITEITPHPLFFDIFREILKAPLKPAKLSTFIQKILVSF